MAIPLAFRGRAIGVLDLESRKSDHFTGWDERLLMTLATRIASALANAELYEQVAENERRFARELEVAREVQRQLLPEPIPSIGPLALAVSFTPAAHLGGDLYDMIRFDDGRLALAVGDVSGKGAPAALYGALVSGVIRTRATRKYPPAEMLELVNRSLQQRPIVSQYIALTYAVCDPLRGQLRVASSGLPYAIHVHQGECRFLDTTGIPLGLFPDSKYQEKVLDLEEGDIVVFYTDGIVESRSLSGEEFGLKRLAGVVNRNRSHSPSEIVGAIRQAVAEYSEHEAADDDQTIMIVKMTAAD
jgi:sigma-B regulation protein RsbU (phosphoserine phosphatase)